MPRLLIVSPRFPPKNAPDLHRVRLSLPHYRRHGWEAAVLCVDPATSDGVCDPDLERSLPGDIAITRVPAWRERACRRLGFGQLGYRSLVPLYLAGRRLLRRQQHDVVFFSTTVFLVFVLGPLWKWQYGCRIVYDFQDPWYSGSARYTKATVPGRWWKYRLDRCIAAILERFAMQAADHIISVSDAYVAALCRRHRRLHAAQFSVIPFGAAADDYLFVDRRRVRPPAMRTGDAATNWVYAGRGGSDMAPVLAVFFACVARLRREEPDFAASLKLHFVGTNYGAPDRLVAPVAAAAGVLDLIDEIPQRQPYFETLARYSAGDAILLVGSVYPDYTASKLLPCIAAKKPVLAFVHRDSLIASLARPFPNVFRATFARTPAEPEFARQIDAGLRWLREAQFDPAAVEEQLKPWSAEALTAAQCAVFHRVAAASPARMAKARRSPRLP